MTIQDLGELSELEKLAIDRGVTADEIYACRVAALHPRETFLSDEINVVKSNN